jgi:hypothetical protein
MAMVILARLHASSLLSQDSKVGGTRHKLESPCVRPLDTINSITTAVISFNHG